MRSLNPARPLYPRSLNPMMTVLINHPTRGVLVFKLYFRCKEFYGRNSLIGDDPQGTTRFSSEATVVFSQINLNSEDSNQNQSPIIKPDTRIDTKVTPI